MKSRQEKIALQYLIVSILSLGVPLVLYYNRHLDNNRLTSWDWVFDDTGGYKLLVLLGAALVAAFGATRIRIQWRPLYLFLFSFLAAALFWTTPEVIVDAARYFTQAKQLKIYGIEYFFAEFGRAIFAWTDLPLVPLLYGLVFKVFGENRIWVQVLNGLFFSGTIMLTYRLGTVLWNEMLGRYAAFLMLGFPYLFTQVPLMLVDVPSMFFLLLAVYSFTCYLLRGGGLRYTVTVFAVFFAVFAKYSLWLYLSVLVVVFVVVLFSRSDRVIMRGAVVFGAILLLCGSMYLFYHEVINGQIELLTSYQKPGLKSWGENFVSTFLFQTHPLLTATAVLSAGAAAMKRDMKYPIIGFLVVVLVFLQVKRARYALPVFPMLALMSSYGIMQLRHPEIRKLLVSCIVSTSLFLSLGGYLPFLHRLSAGNLQHAGKLLDAHNISPAWVVMLPQQEQILNPDISLPLLDIYTGALLIQPPDTETDTVQWSRIVSSPLRFTWEYPLPGYYRENDGVVEPAGLVIIGSRSDQVPPRSVAAATQKFKNKKIFNIATGLFTYKTVVTVYY